MPSPRAAAALVLLGVVGLAGCDTSSSPHALRVATTTGVALSSEGATPAAAPTVASCPTPDANTTPAEAWAAAVSALEGADTSTYRVRSETALPVGTLTRSITVRVDESTQRAEFAGSFSAHKKDGEPVQTSVTLVMDGDEGYVHSPAWTGRQRGKWLRVNQALLAEAEIPLELQAVSSLPPQLASLEPHGVRELHGLRVIDGRISAEDGLSLLGLSHVAAKDPQLAESLTGMLGVSARLNNAGCLDTVELSGENSQVTGSSEAVPAAVLDALIRASTTVLYISSVGAPQSIAVPPPDAIVDGGRI